ncbi:MAG: DUF131 domain-containing protein [Archaeoglobus sp.]|nr:DUF131 domain-containing protein [Archaeoglobus sp.]
MRLDLVFAGFILLMVGLSLLTLSSANVDYGGIILIGPIPIIFGSSAELAFSAALIGIVLLFFLLGIGRMLR